MTIKEEALKKLKTKIKRNKVTVQSWTTGQEMTSRIKDLDIDVVKIDGVDYFAIDVKQIEVTHKLYNVNHHILLKPFSVNALVKDCKWIRDGLYEYEYLTKFNSYESWQSHFRESIWCLAKALKAERVESYKDEVTKC